MIFTEAVDGTDRRWLDHAGLVRHLTFSKVMPGGASTASCVLLRPPTRRPRDLQVGRRVGITRGSRVVWRGRMDSPVPGPGGWQVNMLGMAGVVRAYRSVASGASGALDVNTAAGNAISRGLPVTVPAALPTTTATAPSASLDLGAALDKVAQLGGVTWQVNSDTLVLTTSAFASTPGFILASRSVPPGRTVDGMVNRLYAAYTDSGTGLLALRYAEDTGSAAANGTVEAYQDVTALGQFSAAQVDVMTTQEVADDGPRAQFTDPFTVLPGDLWTISGQPADLPRVAPNIVVRVLGARPDPYGDGTSNGGYTDVLIAATDYDVEAQTLTLHPAQATRRDLLGALSAVA